VLGPSRSRDQSPQILEPVIEDVVIGITNVTRSGSPTPRRVLTQWRVVQLLLRDRLLPTESVRLIRTARSMWLVSPYCAILARPTAGRQPSRPLLIAARQDACVKTASGIAFLLLPRNARCLSAVPGADLFDGLTRGLVILRSQGRP